MNEISLTIKINVPHQLYCISTQADGTVLTKYATFSGYEDSNGDIIVVARTNEVHYLTDTNGTTVSTVIPGSTLYNNPNTAQEELHYKTNINQILLFSAPGPDCPCPLPNGRCCRNDFRK